jgi:hypothetical protein
VKAQARTRMLTILESASSMLVLVPDTPGIADNVAVGGLRVIIAAIMGALNSGKTAAQIVEHLEAMKPAARLDVAGEVEKFVDSE